MNRINIDDEVKILIPESYAYGKVVKVNSIQELTDNSILYTGIFMDSSYSKSGFVKFIQFMEGQYEIINHKSNDFVEDKKNFTVVIKIEDLNEADEVLNNIKLQIEKILNKKN